MMRLRDSGYPSAGRYGDIARLNAFLDGHDSFAEGYALERKTAEAGSALVAWVVPTGPFSAADAENRLRERGFDQCLPDLWVTVSALPRTSAGKVDEVALLELETLDQSVAQQWEEQLQGEASLGEVAVIAVAQPIPAPGRRHLADLIPGWNRADGIRDGASEEGAAPASKDATPSGAKDKAAEAPPSIQFGAEMDTSDLPRNIPAILERAAREAPQRGITYVRADGSDLFHSYPELLRLARRMAEGFRQRGLAPGEKVLLQVARREEFLPVLWGCFLSGLVPVPATVATSYDRNNSAVQRLQNAWTLLDQPLIVADAELAPSIEAVAAELGMTGVQVASLEDLPAEPASDSAHDAAPEDLALMLMTSGSTGKPKLVTHTHGGILYREKSASATVGWNADDTSLNWLTLDHVASLVDFHLRDVFNTSSQVQVPTEKVLEDPLLWWDWIDRYRATVTWSPHFAYELVAERATEVRQRSWDLSCLRCAIDGGDAIVARTARRFLQLMQEKGLPSDALQPVWGMSESASGVAYTHFTLEGSRDDESFVEVGGPIPGMAFRIVDDDQQVVPEGTIGRLQVHGKAVTPGYYKRPDLNREVFTRDGWFRTGDLAMVRNGKLILTGREADFLVINGLNYYSHEIESVIEEVPGVQASFTAALGVRRSQAETDRLAILFHTPLRGDQARSELISKIRDRLLRQTGLHADYVVPVGAETVPKTSIGKIQRSRLKQMFETGELDPEIQEADLLTGNSNTLPDWFYIREWQRRPLAANSGPDLRVPPRRVAVLCGEPSVGEALLLALEKHGMDAVAVAAGERRDGPARHFIARDAGAADYARLLDEISADGGAVTGIVDLREDSAASNLLDLLNALQLRKSREYGEKGAGTCLLLVGEGSQAVRPGEAADPQASILPALARTAHRELQDGSVRHLDLDPTSTVDEKVSLLVKEMEAAGGEPEVAYRAGERWVPRLARLEVAERLPLPFRKNGRYLLAGGLGGVGRELARYLLKQYDARLLLLGRTPVSEQDEALKELAALSDRGEVRYLAVDISDGAAVALEVGKALEEWDGELDGVVHLAAAFHESALADETQEGLAALLRPKADGARHLVRLIEGSDAFFLAFSSVNSHFGGAGIGAYGAANRYLESFCRQLRNEHAGPVYCFAWSMWDETGMSEGYALKELSRAGGFAAIPPGQGVNSLLAALSSGQSDMIIGLDGGNPQIVRHLASPPVQPLQHLCAFHTGEGAAPDLPQVKDLFGRLVGCTLRSLDELPRTDEGKVDREALAALGLRAASAATAEPETEVEKALAAIFAELLKTPRVGLGESFFQLGGHSILATQLLSRLAQNFGAEITAAEFLAGPTVAQLAEKVEAGRSGGAAVEASLGAAGTQTLPQIESDPEHRYEPFPLTEIQQAYWLGSSGAFALGDVSMHFYQEIDVEHLDPEALERAWNRLVRRHDALRAVLLTEGRAQIQERVPDYRFPIDDLRGHDADGVRTHLGSTRERMSRQSFDLEKWPWFEIRVCLQPEDRARVHFSTAVIHLDGGSFFLLMMEWGEFYQQEIGRQDVADLPALQVSYRDYSLALEKIRDTEEYGRSLAYWQERVETLPPAPALPLARSVTSLTTYRFVHRMQEVSPERWRRIQALAHKFGISRSTVVLTAYAWVLGAWSGNRPMTLNVTIFNRLPVHEQINDILGDFTSMVLTAVEHHPEDTFETLARRVQNQLWSDLEHRLVSGVAVQRELARVRGEHVSSLNPVVFTSAIDLDMRGTRSPSSAMAKLGENVFHVSQTPQVLLDFQLFEEAGGLQVVWDAVEEAFPPGLLDSMFSALGGLLESLAEEDSWKGRPHLVPDAHRQLVQSANATDAPRDALLLHRAFEAQAALAPEQPAVIDAHRTMSYAEVEERSNAVAAWLRQHGARKNALVAVAMDKGWQQVVAVLGILKAGAAYLPLDPGLPPERRSFLLENGRADLVLTQARLKASLEWPEAATVLAVDGDEAALAQASATAMEPLEIDEADLAYVIFTSGSTGKPKGVMIDHRGAMNTIADINRRFSVTAKDRVFALSELNFDLSVYDVFGILAAGGTIVIPAPDSRRDPEQWLHALEEHGVTLWNSVPALMEMLVEFTGSRGQVLPGSLRLVLLSGDWIPLSLPDRIRSLAGGSEVISLGGATEASIWSILHPIGEVDSALRSIPYGKPMENQRFYVLDEALEQCPLWVPGMLYIGGDGLALGYWADPEKTAASFINHPESGERLYRTGDLGRYLPDGNIEFLGRDDTQVKVHGHRIELGEIEATLQQHPALAAAVVAAVGQDQRDRRLVAWVVPEEGQEDGAGEEALRTFLESKLPAYMVPTAFVPIDSLPLSANGKVKRDELKLPEELKRRQVSEYVAPRSPTEEALAAMWRELLRVERLGIHDNLLHLGSNSLMAIMALTRIRNLFGVELPLRVLLGGQPTVAKFASKVEELRRQEAVTAHLPTLTAMPSERFEPFPLHAIQEAYWIGRRDAFELGNVAAYFYLEVTVPQLDGARLEKAWQSVIDRHDMLRTVFLAEGRQQVLENVPPYRLEVLDLDGETPEGVEAQLAAIRERMEGQVMSPDRWPLFEFRATRLPGGGAHLHFGLDLLVADAWSVQILFSDLDHFYHRPDASLPPLELTYRDYLVAEETLADSELFRRSQDYWWNRLDTLPGAASLPLTKKLADVVKPQFVRRRAVLEPALWRRLQERAQDQGLTPSGILMAAFAEVLGAWSQSPHFTLNVTTFNRLPLHEQVDHIVGDFTSMTLLECDLRAEDTFEGRARRLQGQLWEDLENRYISGVRVLREQARRGGRGPAALAPIVFTSLLGRYDEAGDDTAFLPLRGDLVYATSQTPQVWLDHQVIELHGGLAFTWDVVEDLLPAGLLDDLFSAYVTLLHRLTEEDAAWGVEGVSLLPREQRQVQVAANQTAVDCAPECLHGPFLDRARQQPERPAVVAGDRTLSYRDLEDISGRVAAWLSAAGVERDELVAVVMEKGWQQVVATVAVVRAGAAYLPIAADLPDERRNYLLKNGKVRFILTQGHLDFVWPEGLETLAVDGRLGAGEPFAGDAERPQDLGYVIFTSGSTGVPKGVMIEHRAAMNTILDINRRFAVGGEDRALGLSALGFDLSVYDIFGMLSAGGTVVLPPPAADRDPAVWLELLESENVTVWNSAPPLMEMLVEYAEPRGLKLPACLRLILLSGDWIPVRLPDRLRKLAPNAQVVSLGGATEASIWSIFYPIADVADDWRSIPYGKPLDNQHFHVLDHQLEPRPMWVPGELYISGQGLARGYWEDPEKTASSFLTHTRSGVRLYRTGDWGRYLPDGNIEFLGRQDHQVKIQGHRIELGEIEAVLEAHPAVETAIALVADTGASRRLVVCFTAAGEAPTADELRKAAAARLPGYMVPSSFVALDTLPLTSNGKVDRSALQRRAEAAGGERGGTEAVAPRTAVEEELARRWREALGLSELSVHDSLFDLGGNSLVAIQMLSAIQKDLGVEVSLRHLFENPTVAGLASQIEALRGQAGEGGAAAPELPALIVDPDSRYEPFPLNHIQQAYFLGRTEGLELGNVAAHFYFEVELETARPEQLREAWQGVVERHDMLRVVFHSDGRQQVLREMPQVEMPIHDLRGRSEAERRESLDEVRERLSHEVLPVDRWPLFGLEVSRLQGDRVRLHVSFDLLIADAWSTRLLFLEFARRFQDPSLGLEPLELSFRDYVMATEELSATLPYQRARRYWDQRLPELPAAPELPLARDPSSLDTPRFERRSGHLPPDQWRRLQEQASKAGITPSGLLLAAYAEVLGRWSDTPRFTVNVTTFNRWPIHPQIHDVVGDFTSLTLVAVDQAPGGSFEERARRVQKQLWEDLDHRQVSGIEVLRDIARARGRAPGALMPVVFTSRLFGKDEAESFLDLLGGEVVYSISQTPQVWLDMQVAEDAGELVWTWDSVEGLFPPGLVDAMFAAFTSLLEGLVAADESWACDHFPLLPAAQRERARKVNDTAAPMEETTLHALVARQVEARGEAPAVIAGGESLSYRQLAERSRRLAGWLREKGAQPDQLVAIVMEKGWEQAVAALAVVDSGAAYLPIDPKWPEERRNYLLDNGEVRLVLTQERFEADLTGLEAQEVFAVTAARLEGLPQPGTWPAVAQPEHLAYVIFTSGSTGQPKGVAIEHRSAVNTILDVNARFGVGPDDRALGLSALTFDLSVYDFFGVLAAGGTLVLPEPEALRDPSRWGELLNEHKVTLWNSVPALLELLLEHAESHPAAAPTCLRLALLSGDWLPLTIADRLRAVVEKAGGEAPEVISLGGATEASIWSILYPVEQVRPEWASIPYGMPMLNQEFHVVDGRLQQRPDWVAGDLYIGGVGLAREYWRDESKTAAAFIRDPETGRRLYRTGDRGRYLPDGNIEFLGRADFQVKVQGYRIELGEIEAALLRHPEIASAVVTAPDSPREGGGRRLVACIIREPDAAAPLDVPALRAFLGGILPEYMVPATVVEVESMPLSANGKVDRSALEAWVLGEFGAGLGAAERTAPRTPLEARLCALWCELLDVEAVGVHDNLFDLGGNSLLAIQLNSAIRDRFQAEVSLQELFRKPTVAHLAGILAQARAADGEGGLREALPAIVPDRENRNRPFPLNEVQQAYWVGRMQGFELGSVAAHSYTEVENVDFDLESFERAFRVMIDRHDALRTIIRPDGLQQILPEVPPYEIRVQDLRGRPDDEVQAELEAVRQELSHQVLTVEEWPIFDVRASRMDGGRTRLHLSFDLLISDAWSSQILFSELARVARDPHAHLPELEISVRDYILAEETIKETALYQRSKDYWEARIPTLPPTPELPMVKAPDESTPRFVRRTDRLPAERWDRIKDAGKGIGVTPSGLLLSAFCEVLAAWSKSPRFTINLTTFARLPLHPQVNDIMGDFTSLTLLEADYSGDDALAIRARRLQEQLWADLDHRFLNGVTVMRDLARVQGRPVAALMPVVFTSRLFRDGSFGDEVSDFDYGEVVYSVSQTPQVWLDHQVVEEEDGLSWTWDVVEELFPEGFIDQLFTAYSRLLNDLSEDPARWQRPVGTLLPPAEEAVRRQINDTAAALPEELLHGRVAEFARTTPSAPAVLGPERSLSYRELHHAAERVGRWLRQRGARPDTLVAVVMEKGWEQVVAALGVLYSGAAYLPVDPDLPVERLHFLLDKGEVELALSQSWVGGGLAWPEGREIPWLAVDRAADDAALDGEPLAAVQRAEDLAYVIFTSGTTGQPKGVAIEHGAAMNTVLDINRRLAMGPDDRTFALSALNFDLSVYDIFGPLAAGGAVVVPRSGTGRDPEHWAEVLRRHRVTVWNSVPSLMEMLVEHGEGNALPDSLRAILLSGDWIPLTLPPRLQRAFPQARVTSLGGATEASIWSIAYPIETVDPEWKSVPYGRPLDNQSFHVLDEALRPRPVWVPGELYIGGIGLAREYWRDEERTGNAFITHPETGERLYRTGDLGRYLPGGDIEFLGREDTQVKIQGYRIELGEIEAALQQHPAVRAAVIDAPPVAGGADSRARRLVAYVVRERLAAGASGKETAPAGEGGAQLARSAAGFDPVTDPMERLIFKLNRGAVRKDLEDQPSLALPAPDLDAAQEAKIAGRRTFRRFEQKPVDLATLGALLSNLRQIQPNGLPLPKYLYPSGGGLYPVQLYVAVREGGVAGLEAGIYVYHGREHSLLKRSSHVLPAAIHGPENRTIARGAAFTLFMVSKLSAIAPLYPDTAREFCLLEAGYMGQLLMEEAPRHDLGLCPLGGMRFESVREHFGLEGSDELIHILAGGAIAGPSTSLEEAWREEQDPLPEAEDGEDEDVESAVGARGDRSEAERPDWRALAIADPFARLEFKLSQHGLPRRDPAAQEVALPAPAVDEDLVRRYAERRSCRHFEGAEIPLEEFGAWLASLRSFEKEGLPLPKYRYPSGGGLYPVQTYLYVKPGRIEGVAGGSYYHDPVKHRLIRLQDGAIFDRSIHGAVNQTIFDGSAFSLFLVAPMSAVAPLYPELAEDFCLLEAGYMGQLLMTEGAEHRIGLTPVGGVRFEQIRDAFHLADEHRLVHLFEGGPIAEGPATVAHILKDQNPPPPLLQREEQPSRAAADQEGEPALEGPPVTVSAEELKAFLGEKLPHYMVPPTVIFLDEIPLSANGKVDRKALPLAEHPPEAKEKVAPRNDLEQQLAELVAEVLNTDAVGINDNFFELGATSVDIIKIQRLIQLRLERDVEMTRLFRQPTILDLAQGLSALEDDQETVDAGLERARRRKEAGRARPRRSRESADSHE